MLLPTNMVRVSSLAQLRTRKQNTNRAVPLDAVPERRTERCSQKFRPGDRFCELQIPVARGGGREMSAPRPSSSTQPDLQLVTIFIYTTQRSSYFLHVVHSSVS